jgi:hypothetical protein
MSPWLSATVPDSAFQRFPAVAPSGMPSPPSRWATARPGWRILECDDASCWPGDGWLSATNCRKPPHPRESTPQVTVATAKVTVKDGQGRGAEGLMLTCSRCGETVEVLGTSGASIRHGCVKLREACKEKTNFYVEEELHPEAPPPRSAARTE